MAESTGWNEADAALRTFVKDIVRRGFHTITTAQSTDEDGHETFVVHARMRNPKPKP